MSPLRPNGSPRPSPVARTSRRAWLVALAATALLACSHTPDDLPAGPDCALLAKTDLACIDYPRSCRADADCGAKPAECTKDGATSLGYSGGICKSGNCGYSVTPTTCVSTCAAGVCPGDAGM